MKTQKLYKLDSKSKVRVWWGETVDGGFNMHHGLKDGKIQTRFTAVDSGKNIGRANETTPEEQAKLELQSKYNKQVDKGYLTEDKFNPSAGQAMKVVRPMLAHRYDKHPHKISFPCFIQPKLDGIRCLGFPNKLESRRGKPFTVLGHIQDEVSEVLSVGKMSLDGELYVHGEDFQKIISAIKRDKPIKESGQIEYHVYDTISKANFNERYTWIQGRLLELDLDHIKLVPTYTIDDKSEIITYHQKFLSMGYEGSILRNLHGPYEIDKRSYNLQKVKDFIDQEFKIVDYKVDKDECCVFCCVTQDNAPFDVRPEGTIEQRQRYITDFNEIKGKMLTVRFFEWTTSDPPVPRFPVGVAVRDYE